MENIVKFLSPVWQNIGKNREKEGKKIQFFSLPRQKTNFFHFGIKCEKYFVTMSAKKGNAFCHFDRESYGKAGKILFVLWVI